MLGGREVLTEEVRIRKPVNLASVLMKRVPWGTGLTEWPGGFRVRRKCVSLWFSTPVSARRPPQKGSLSTTGGVGPEAAGSVPGLSSQLLLATLGDEISFGTWCPRDSLELSVTLKREPGC